MDESPMDAPVWAFSGVPGSGKTTLTAALAERSGRTLVRTRDIVSSVDPGALTEGRLADAEVMYSAMRQFLEGVRLPSVIDGLPRTRDQLALLPPGSMVFVLWCNLDVAMFRLRDRGRPDDSPDKIRRRYHEQEAEMRRDGWLADAATYRRRLNTSMRSRQEVLDGVWAYIVGEKREVY